MDIKPTNHGNLVDGGYGWVNVAAAAILNGNSWGLATAYSVFQSYYTTHSSDDNTNTNGGGISPLNYAAISGLQTSQAVMIAPLATYLLGRLGIRGLIWLGVLVQTASLVGASFVASPPDNNINVWQLYLGQGVGFGWGIGLILVAQQNVVPQWFTSSGSLASGVAGFGVGVGGLVWSYLAAYLLEHLTPGRAIRVLALSAGILMAGAGILVRDRGAVLGQRFGWIDASKGSGLCSARYGVLLVFAFVLTMADMAVLTQMTTYGETVLGLEGDKTATVSAMVAVGIVVGRPAVGYASDKLGRLNVAVAVPFLAGVLTLAVWINTQSFGGLIFYALCLGVLGGVFWSIIGPVTVEIMGLRTYPDTISGVFLAIVVPSAVSPVIALKLAETDGGYLGVQLYASMLFFGASLICLVLRAWKLESDRTIRERLGDDEYNQLELKDEYLGDLRLGWNMSLLRAAFRPQVV